MLWRPVGRLLVVGRAEPEAVFQAVERPSDRGSPKRTAAWIDGTAAAVDLQEGGFCRLRRPVRCHGAGSRTDGVAAAYRRQSEGWAARTRLAQIGNREAAETDSVVDRVDGEVVPASLTALEPTRAKPGSPTSNPARRLAGSERIETGRAMKTLAKLALGVVMSMSLGGVAAAQFQPGKPLPAPPAPAATPATHEVDAPVRVVAQTVKGNADFRPRRPDAPVKHNEGMSSQDQLRAEGWVSLKSGMAMPEGSEVRTGLNGEIVLRIGDTQEITIRSLTQISVRQAVRRAGQATTRIGIEYGDLRADVDSTRIANDVRIEAPDVTLTVTGTSFFLATRPGFPTVAGGMKGNTGKFKADYANGESTTISGDQQTDSKTPTPRSGCRTPRSWIPPTTGPASPTKTLAKRSVGGGDATIVSLGVLPARPPAALRPQREPTQVHGECDGNLPYSQPFIL